MQRHITATVLYMSSSLPSSQQHQQRMKFHSGTTDEGMLISHPRKKLSKVELAAQRKRDTWRARTTQFMATQLLAPPTTATTSLSSSHFSPATTTTNITTIVNPASLTPKDIYTDAGDAGDKSASVCGQDVGGSSDGVTPASGFPSGDVLLIHNGGSMCNINPSALLGYLHESTQHTYTSSPPPPPPRLFVSSSGTFSGVLAPRGANGDAVSMSRLLQLLNPPPSSSGVTDSLDAAGVFKKCSTTPNVAGVFHVDVLRRYVRVNISPPPNTAENSSRSTADVMVGGCGGSTTTVVVDLFALIFPAARLITRGVYPTTPTTASLPTTTTSDTTLRGRVICGVPEGGGGGGVGAVDTGPCRVVHLGTLPSISSPSTSSPPVSLFGFPDVCPGLYILPNFVTPDEEHALLRYLFTSPHQSATTDSDIADEEHSGASLSTTALSTPPPKWDFLLGGRKVMHMNRRFIFENNSCGPTVADLQQANPPPTTTATNHADRTTSLSVGGVDSEEDPWGALVPTHPIVSSILKRLHDAATTTTTTTTSSSSSSSVLAQEHIREALSFQHTKYGDGESRGVVTNFDQLTINEYPPGSGIPSHVDAHHCFHNPILSISLGVRECVMNLREPKRLAMDDAVASGTCSAAKKQEEGGRRVEAQPRDGGCGGRGVDVFLPRGSLLILSGLARYAFTHGIDDKVFHTVGGEVMAGSEPPMGVHHHPCSTSTSSNMMKGNINTTTTTTTAPLDNGYNIDSRATPFVDPNVRYSISCRAAKVVPGCEDCQAPHLCDGIVYSSPSP